MRWRRRSASPPEPELAGALQAFRHVVARVEEAKEVLLLGVPSGRAPRIPLAEALVGFEEGLREVVELMPAWRHPLVEHHWASCASALEAASVGAERLRLEASPEGYEELAPLLDDLLSPLEAFSAAAERFGRLVG